MVHDIAGSRRLGDTRAAGSLPPREEVSKEREALQNQIAKLAAILSGSRDTVEISDKARALSEAAKNSRASSETSARHAGAPAAVQKSMDSREGRDAVAKDYNAVLEELRGTYGEEEAMRRFDEFMESEGFERVTEESHGMSPSGGLSGVLRAFAGGRISSAGMPHIGRDVPLASNLSASSSIKGTFVNGEVQYLAETYANYAANANQDVFDALSGLYRKNLESAQRGTSIDLDAYMKNNFGSDSQTSVVSASADLGAVAGNLIETAGIELGEDGKVSFSLKEDGSGLFISGADDNEAAQKAIDAALQKNPDMLNAFKSEYSRVALTDTSTLDGAYNDGTRSIEYGDVRRSFTYSAQEPSVAVMTDFISVEVGGYNYQKKVSDSFDTNADFHSISDGGIKLVNNNGQITLDPGDVAANQTIRQKMSEDIQHALETGEKIGSSMSRKAYDAVQAERSAGFVDPATLAAGAKLYTSAPNAEQEAKAAEARQALADLEAAPDMREKEISYRDEQLAAQKATVSQLLDLFAPGRKTPGLTVINSIMESLRSTSAIR